jgi:MFS family permease
VTARRPLSRDARKVLAAQALRAFAYGLGSVLLGTTLDDHRFSSVEAGLVLGAVVAGTVVASLAVGWRGDRWGRRRTYAALYALLAATGAVFAFAGTPWVLAVVALAGALSTEVVESGPFTSLEQAMLADELTGHELVRGLSLYNAIAAAAGAAGALAALAPAALREIWDAAPAEQRWFLLFVPIAAAGAVIAGSLSAATEPARVTGGRAGLDRSRRDVTRLAALFATDSFGGGFVVQAFIAFWAQRRFDATTGEIGVLFAAIGVVQTASFLAAGRLARRFGLLPTMVFSHLPSNLLLITVAFAPSFPVAAALLLGRTALSQMDVPTRQAYVLALVDPAERTAAASVTGTVRYLARPAGPPLAGALSASVALGAPFVVAGAIKATYDLVLWRWFAGVRLPEADNQEIAA